MQRSTTLPRCQVLAIVLLLPLSVFSAGVPYVTEIAHGAPADSTTPDILEHGTHDISKVASEPGHPMAGFISERLKRQLPVQHIWVEVASHYSTESLYKEALGIHESMLAEAIAGKEQLSTDTLRLICKGIAALPAHFQKWQETEDELFLLFKGWQGDKHASSVLTNITDALSQNGQTEKAIALMRRFVSAYPDDIIGVEAMQLVPASALLYLEIASEQQGTRVGAIAHYRLAETRANQGKTAEAISAYEGFLRRYPDHKEAAYALGRFVRICEDRGGLELALNHSDEILKYVVAKDAIRVRVSIAAIHRKLGNDAEFLATYLSILDKHQKRQPQEACRAVLDGANRAYRDEMLHAAADLYEAYALLLGKMNELPVRHLPRSEANDQDRTTFWRACMEITTDRQSVGAIRGFCESHSHSLEAAYGHYVLAQLALEENRVQDALEYTDALVGDLPDSPAALRLRGEVHTRLHGADLQPDALHQSSGAEHATSDGPETTYKLAQNMMRSGASIAAIRQFNFLAAEWPESPLAVRALFDAALIYRDELENHEKMIDRLECVLTLYPETELGATAMQLLNRIGEATE